MTEILAFTSAYLCGLAARQLGLPPLVGYLLAGFVLHFAGLGNTDTLHLFAELGITLLLFTIGLKLDLRSLLKPQIWAVGGLHLLLSMLLGMGLIWLLASMALGPFASLNPTAMAVIAFGLSFSSTVFVVKVLEEHGDMNAFYGRIAIGVLIIQDIAAVIFLAFSANKLPSVWALGLILLIPFRKVLHRMLEASGHGELQILFGLSLALGGAMLFESVGVKGDLGALILGLLLAGSSRSTELVKHLLAFKDLFLVSFFLTIGLQGGLDMQTLLAAVVLGIVLLPIKSVLFFLLFSRSGMRARSAFLSALSLLNFSEFGLIVAVIAVQNMQLLQPEWTTILAIALALSFILAAPLNHASHQLYRRWRTLLLRFQGTNRLPEEMSIRPGSAQVLVFGMGRLGSNAYEQMKRKVGDAVLGIDQNEAVVERHQQAGRRVELGSSSDPEFWERMHGNLDQVCLAMLTLPTQRENLETARSLKREGYQGFIAAIARYPDEVPQLLQEGVDMAMNLYDEAGSGFADDVWQKVEPCIRAHQEKPASDPGDYISADTRFHPQEKPSAGK